jgi:hypothetical protein
MRIADELLLLAYDDDGTAVAGSPALDYALAGAVLADLALDGRIDLVDRRVSVTDATPLGDPVLDVALARIDDDKARTPTRERLRAAGDPHSEVLTGLVLAAELGSTVFDGALPVLENPHWTVRAARTAIDEMQAAIAMAATTGAVSTILTSGNT